MQFVVLSDSNATWFVGQTSAPIFRDPAAGRPSWTSMQPGTIKHDTFVFNRNAERSLYWKASANSLATLKADIKAAVLAVPP